MDNGFAFTSTLMLAFVLLACHAVQDVWGGGERSMCANLLSWTCLGARPKLDEKLRMKNLADAAREAYESLSDTNKDLTDEEVAEKVRAIERYEAEDNSRPLQFNFAGLRIGDVLRHSPPSLSECANTTKLLFVLDESARRSPGWQRFVSRIFKAQIDVCDEDARQSVTMFKHAYPKEWQLIVDFVKTAGGEVAMQDEKDGDLNVNQLKEAVFRPTGEISENKRMNEAKASRLARELKEACELFWTDGLKNTHESLLRYKDAARYRMVCRQVHKFYDESKLFQLIQLHAMLGTKF